MYIRCFLPNSEHDNHLCIRNIYSLLIKHSRVDFVKKSETAKEKEVFASFLIPFSLCRMPFVLHFITIALKALLNVFFLVYVTMFWLFIWMNGIFDGFLYRFRSDPTCCMLYAFLCFSAFHFITQFFFLSYNDSVLFLFCFVFPSSL